MKQNPFSFFDFLGYLFPGTFASVIIYIVFVVGNCEVYSIYDIFDAINSDCDAIRDNILIYSSISLVFCYIIGHIIAYMSSIFVERFSIWWYGYPSYFLLNKSDKFHLKDDYNHSENKEKSSLVIRYIVILLLLPIVVPSLVIHKLGWDRFFVKTLDTYLQNTIKEKRERLSKELGLVKNDDDKTDFHRVMYHYEYENLGNHRIKMDNYIALYDFLRSLTLIFNMLCWYLIYLGDNDDLYNFKIYWFWLLVVIVVTFLMFMSFMKFYRRFTLEIFMCLITDRSLVSDEDRKRNQPIYTFT